MVNVLNRGKLPDLSSLFGQWLQRSIGIGVSGFWDAISLLGLSFVKKDDVEKIRIFNRKVFREIYFSAMKQSVYLVKTGKADCYPMFEGSPLSEGQLCFDNYDPDCFALRSNTYDWDMLKEDLMIYGCAVSNVTTVMPTATTAKIRSVSEAVEPRQGHMYMHRLNIGEVMSVNPFMYKELFKRGLWNPDKLIPAIKNNRGWLYGIDPELQWLGTKSGSP